MYEPPNLRSRPPAQTPPQGLDFPIRFHGKLAHGTHTAPEPVLKAVACLLAAGTAMNEFQDDLLETQRVASTAERGFRWATVLADVEAIIVIIEWDALAPGAIDLHT
jgi:hypothetical protein